MRHDTIGALGNDVIKTPGIDRLVREGTTFSQATTPCPVCMPARWSLHTGQWSTTHKCYSNHHPGPAQAYNLPLMMRRAGYLTGLIGKNHSFLSSDDVLYFDEHPKPSNKHTAKIRKQWIEEKASKEFPRLCREPVPGGIQADPDFAKTEAAIRFVKQAKDSPFFLWLSYHHPHTPYYVPAPFFSMYKDADIPKPVKEDDLQAAGKPFRQQFHQQNNDAILPYDEETVMFMRRVYYGQISMLDREIKGFIDFLESKKILDNTLIIFMSDHGDYMGDHGLMTKSPSLYDCLVRTPLIMRYPAKIPMAQVTDELASHVDIMPTILDMIGVKKPDTVQGKNLLPYIQKKETGLREYVFSEYGCPGEAYTPERLEAEGISPGDFTNPNIDNIPWEGNPVSLSGRIRMIKNQHWKLVEETSGPGELYDLDNDPNELVNLFDKPEHAKIQRELQAKLNGWKASLTGEI